MPRPRTFPHQIESERLILRGYELNDTYSVFSALAASREHLRPWMPFADDSLADMATSIQRSRESFERMDEFMLGIFAKEDGRFLGGTNLSRIDWYHGRFDIGYWLRESETGKGYATESTWRLISFAFEELGAERMEIRIAPDNWASRAIPERLGCQLEGIMRHASRHQDAMRDMCLYSLIRPDYENHPRRRKV